MTKKEQLEELKERLFLLDMKDRWDEEDRKYYDEKSNTYVCKENEKFIDLTKLNSDLNVEANIDVKNIVAIDANGNRWHIGGVKNDN